MNHQKRHKTQVNWSQPGIPNGLFIFPQKDQILGVYYLCMKLTMESNIIIIVIYIIIGPNLKISTEQDTSI